VVVTTIGKILNLVFIGVDIHLARISHQDLGSRRGTEPAW
jgi:hypothetical protein